MSAQTLLVPIMIRLHHVLRSTTFTSKVHIKFVFVCLTGKTSNVKVPIICKSHKRSNRSQNSFPQLEQAITAPFIFLLPGSPTLSLRPFTGCFSTDPRNISQCVNSRSLSNASNPRICTDFFKQLFDLST